MQHKHRTKPTCKKFGFFRLKYWRRKNICLGHINNFFEHSCVCALKWMNDCAPKHICFSWFDETLRLNILTGSLFTNTLSVEYFDLQNSNKQYVLGDRGRRPHLRWRSFVMSELSWGYFEGFCGIFLLFVVVEKVQKAKQC